MLSYTSTHWQRFLVIACAAVNALWISPSNAQITPDSTLPNNSTVNLQGNTTLIEGGTKSGGNLFHSFKEFSVPNGTGTYFNNSIDINNILTRVTGGSISNIDGLIKANGTANLFLVNPAGIVFGENARLDIGGSFVGTTADAIAFDEDNLFRASNPQNDSSLLQINPNALFFNQIQAASIENNSIADVGLNPFDEYPGRGLRVPDGKSLLLVGGDVNINGGGLVALGGRVELGGLAGTGTVGLNVDGNNFSINFSSGVEKSDITLSNAARVKVAADGGGSIAVNARNLEMTGITGERSFLLTGINENSGSEQSKAGNIDINATNTINLSQSDITNQVQIDATGQAGDVNISTSKLKVENGSRIIAATRGEGSGGNLNINAQDVELIRDSGSLTGLFAQARPESTGGDGGDLNLKTNTLSVLDGAIISTSNFGAGKGGNLTIDAQDVQLIGTSKDGRFLSALFASALSKGDAGNLTIKTNTLRLEGGAQVSPSTSGAGKGGNLTIDAQDVQVIGTSKDGWYASGLFSNTRSTGDAGNLTIKTNTLLVEGGAEVDTSTFGAGNGGNLTIDAQDVQVIGKGKYSAPSGLFATAQEKSSGDAGDLTINASTLQVENSAEVSVRNLSSEGTAGNLKINADSIRLNNNAQLSAATGTNKIGPETADQATIKINSQDLIMRGRSFIFANATVARGGNIDIDADIIAGFEGSDITAMSTNFRGGNVRINTQGIFGFQSRPRKVRQRDDLFFLDDINDINASGNEEIEDSDGIVEIITPNIDLNSGLVTLPSIPVEAEIAQVCGAGSSVAQSRFEIIGRGGLPQLPTDALSADAVEVDLVSIKPQINKPAATNVSTKHKTSTPKKIVEATGWIRNDKGEIFFVADAVNKTQVNNWYKKNNCRG